MAGATRPLLRIARRDALRARGRSALIVAMVALPVLGVSFIDVMVRTGDVDASERVSRELGRADARIEASYSGNPVLQPVDGAFTMPPTRLDDGGSNAEPPPDEPPVDPRTLFPTGSSWVSIEQTEVQLRTTDGLTRATLREFDYANPVADGVVTQLDGRSPRTVDEVVVTPALLGTLGLEVGDPLPVQRPEKTLTIVGTFRDLDDSTPGETALALPGAVIDALRADGFGDIQPTRYLLDSPGPVTWDQVLGYNAAGIGVFSRYVVEHPPPDAEVPFLQDPSNLNSGSGIDFAIIGVAMLVVGLAMLEVILLAGAAFAVGARRQSRSMGLLAATGGESRHVRRVVLSQGAVLGAVGGLAASVGGLLAGVAAAYTADRWFDASLGPVDVRPLEMLGIAVLGVVTGLLAAAVPARNTARQDVVAALRGRRGVVRTGRRWPIAGVVAALAGAALALAGGAFALAAGPDGATGGRAATAALMILVGAVVTQIGLIVATPAIVGGVGRLGRHLPLGPRLAVRDAARHRGRSAPAVAAVLGAVAGSIALSVYVSAVSDHDRRAYQPTLPYGAAAVSLYAGQGERPDTDAVIDAVTKVVRPDEAGVVRTLSEPNCADVCRSASVIVPVAKQCPLWIMSTPPSSEDQARYADDPRCAEDAGYASGFSGPVVGSYADFVRIFQVESEAARRVLAAGGLVAFGPNQVEDGKGVIQVTTYRDDTDAEAQTGDVQVPAAYVELPGGRFADSFVSDAAARQSGVPAVDESVLLRFDEPPSGDQEEAVRDRLERLGLQTWFEVERGYRDDFGPGLLALLLGSAVITLGAAGIATGLAQADARADHATLAAVGAPARLRRTLSAAQAVTVAGLGTVLGTLSGFVPVVSYLYADPEYAVVVPWRNVVLIVVVVPLVAAACAWLFTRSRLPMERRIPA